MAHNYICSKFVLIATGASSSANVLTNAFTSIKVSTTLLNSNLVFENATSALTSRLASLGPVLSSLATFVGSQLSKDTDTVVVTSIFDSMHDTSTIGKELYEVSTKLSSYGSSALPSLLPTSEFSSWQTSKMSGPLMTSTAAFYTFYTMTLMSVVIPSSGKGTDQNLSGDANSSSPAGEV